MRIIFQFELRLLCKQTYTMPEGSKMLSIQLRNTRLFLWTEVDQNRNSEQVTIHSFATNEEIPLNLKLEHISTVQMGYNVWHFYKEINN